MSVWEVSLEMGLLLLLAAFFAVAAASLAVLLTYRALVISHIPKQWGNPIITLLFGSFGDGTIPDIFTRHRYLVELQRKFGAICCLLQPLCKPVIFIHPERGEPLPSWWSTAKTFRGPFGDRSFGVPHSLLGLPAGREWASHRKIVALLFSRRSLEGCMGAIHASTEELAKLCEAGGVLDLYPLLHAWSLDVIGRCAFGHEFGALAATAGGEGCAFTAAAALLNDGMVKHQAFGYISAISRRCLGGTSGYVSDGQVPGARPAGAPAWLAAGLGEAAVLAARRGGAAALRGHRRGDRGSHPVRRRGFGAGRLELLRDPLPRRVECGGGRGRGGRAAARRRGPGQPSHPTHSPLAARSRAAARRRGPGPHPRARLHPHASRFPLPRPATTPPPLRARPRPAGHETSSNTACWALHLLATSQPQQERCRAEVDRAFESAEAKSEAAGTSASSTRLCARLFRRGGSGLARALLTARGSTAKVAGRARGELPPPPRLRLRGPPPLPDRADHAPHRAARGPAARPPHPRGLPRLAKQGGAQPQPTAAPPQPVRLRSPHTHPSFSAALTAPPRSPAAPAPRPHCLVLTASQVALGLDPNLFSHPHAFDPERYARGEHGPHGAALATFGAGPRICVGLRLAETELCALLALLLRRFEIEPAGPAPREWCAVTNSPRQSGLSLRLVPREWGKG